eukprot:TRINITY_DN4454_c0_g1_i2.p1 TRINITY_DN4454_c0_g1~~TRINITY_DN4454_c0_g1_i2.p1  ORF type:complete len:606 (+),score=91.51 TRINITY_DN4454_c0_g1_i2:371-2188(+)
MFFSKTMLESNHVLLDFLNVECEGLNVVDICFEMLTDISHFVSNAAGVVVSIVVIGLASLGYYESPILEKIEIKLGECLMKAEELKLFVVDIVVYLLKDDNGCQYLENIDSELVVYCTSYITSPILQHKVLELILITTSRKYHKLLLPRNLWSESHNNIEKHVCERMETYIKILLSLKKINMSKIAIYLLGNLRFFAANGTHWALQQHRYLYQIITQRRNVESCFKFRNLDEENIEVLSSYVYTILSSMVKYEDNNYIFENTEWINLCVSSVVNCSIYPSEYYFVLRKILILFKKISIENSALFENMKSKVVGGIITLIGNMQDKTILIESINTMIVLVQNNFSRNANFGGLGECLKKRSFHVDWEVRDSVMELIARLYTHFYEDVYLQKKELPKIVLERLKDSSLEVLETTLRTIQVITNHEYYWDLLKSLENNFPTNCTDFLIHSKGENVRRSACLLTISLLENPYSQKEIGDVIDAHINSLLDDTDCEIRSLACNLFKTYQDQVLLPIDYIEKYYNKLTLLAYDPNRVVRKASLESRYSIVSYLRKMDTNKLSQNLIEISKDDSDFDQLISSEEPSEVYHPDLDLWPLKQDTQMNQEIDCPF